MPAHVRQFLFDVIDSVEQLDVLVQLYQASGGWLTPQTICNELRSSLSSIQGRLDLLENAALVEKVSDPSLMYRMVQDEVSVRLVKDVVDYYRQKKQSVFQIIFSPLKKGRTFAEAFVVVRSHKGNGGKNG